MKRCAVIIGLLLFLTAPLARGQGVEIDEPTPVSEAQETQDIQDRTQEDACDCCQKCKAAKSSLKTKEEEGATEKDGCNDCCSRCSEPVKNLPDEPPPEVIEKAPPDVMEKEEK